MSVPSYGLLLIVQLLSAVLAGLVMWLAAVSARRASQATARAPLVVDNAPHAASAMSPEDAATPSAFEQSAGSGPAGSGFPLVGYLVTGVGVVLVLAGIIWASVVGFYASDLPMLIGLLAAGALVSWIGQRLLKASKRSAVRRDGTN